MPSSESIDEQAADWLLDISERPGDESLIAAFEHWKARDPRHAQAAQRMQAFVNQMQALRGQSAPVQAALRAGFKPRKRGGKRAVQGALLVAFAALPLFIFLRANPPSYWLADLRTAPAQWREENLIDHSRLVLAGNSAVDVHFDGSQRRIELLRGEILVDVAKDPARPFIVETEHGSMRALGTRFTVRRENDVTILTMLESRVAAHGSASSVDTDVSAGERARITPQQVRLDGTVDASSTGDAWNHHQLVVQDRPLGEVLDVLASQRRGLVRFDATELAGLRVSAVLPLDDPERALQLIADALPVRVRQFTPWLVVVDRL